MLGYASELIVGSSIKTIMPPSLRDRHDMYLSRLANNSATQEHYKPFVKEVSTTVCFLNVFVSSSLELLTALLMLVGVAFEWREDSRVLECRGNLCARQEDLCSTNGQRVTTCAGHASQASQC